MTRPHDEALVEAVGVAIAAAHLEFSQVATIPHWANHLARAALSAMEAVGEPQTADDLLAVPVGAVVRSSAGTVACRFDRKWGVVFGRSDPFEWNRLALPATVLWRPVKQEAER